MALASHLQLLFRPSPPLLSLFHSVKTLPLQLNSSRHLSSPFSLRVSSSAPPSSLLSQPIDSVEVGDEHLVERSTISGDAESAVKVLSPVTLGKTSAAPELTVKEKKELASHAHSLGDKLKSQQVGKSGVTDNVIFAFNETLEANELLKLKIHRTCPGELDEIVKQLEVRTGSVAVGRIGRIVIFYRPSVTKMKAEEKKKQARKVFLQRKFNSRPRIQGRERGSRESGPGLRGSSRFNRSTRSYSDQ